MEPDTVEKILPLPSDWGKSKRTVLELKNCFQRGPFVKSAENYEYINKQSLAQTLT